MPEGVKDLPWRKEVTLFFKCKEKKPGKEKHPEVENIMYIVKENIEAGRSCKSWRRGWQASTKFHPTLHAEKWGL